MPVEETMWNACVPQDIDRYDIEGLRAALEEVIRRQLSPGKRLLRAVAWSPNAGALFRPKPGVRRFAVAYEVALSA
jgi:hypothetical protein